jgi:arylformamidase
MNIRDISRISQPVAPAWTGVASLTEEAERTRAPGCAAQADAAGALAGSEGRVSLLPYIGPARVIDLRYGGGAIMPEAVHAYLACAPSRILFRTRAASAQEAQNADLATIHPETLEMLATRGVLLVGIDTPSIDPENSETMDARRTARRANMRVLEGLLLNGVPAGDYELIALPLSAADPEASPVRAILRDLV